MTNIPTIPITNAICERRNIITKYLCDFLSTDVAKLTSMYDYYLTGKIHILKGHRDSVWCINVLPNGKIVSGSSDHTIRIWDPETGNCEKILYHLHCVMCIIILSNEHIIIGDNSYELHIWNLENHKSELFGRHNSEILCCTKISNEMIVSGSRCGEIKIWRLNCLDHKKEYIKECIKTFQNDNSVFSIIHLHDKKIVSGDSSGWIKLWDYSQESNDCAIARHEHNNIVHSLIALSNERIISVSWNESQVKIIKNITNELSEILGVSYGCLNVLPDGRLIGCSDGEIIKICNIDNKKKFNLNESDFTTFTPHCCKVLLDGRVVFGFYNNFGNNEDDNNYLVLIT